MAACVVNLIGGEADVHARLFTGRLNVPPIRLAEAADITTSAQ